MPNSPTLASLADDLENGRTCARKLVDECLVRIADGSGEGARTFLHVDAEAAIEAAEAMGPAARGESGGRRPCRIPVSIKDLFDIKGQVTRAGSRALEDFSPGGGPMRRGGAGCACRFCRDRPDQHDRVRLFRDRHQPALRHAEERMAARCGHVPGGSSSGAAVSSLTEWHMARSAPIPVAPAGYRPPITASSLSSRRSGAFRLTAVCRCPFTLDSFGPLARSVACCAVLDAVLANEAIVPLQRARSRECVSRCRPRRARRTR
jgi:aspartyl-tRNA(Asn)/glutamyl-tRNA(Gln) amidotransferase subunit A